MGWVAELRWILAALCGVLLLGIIWWGRRRSAQSPGRPELREPTLTAAAELPAAEPRDFGPATRERRASPLEPLSIHTAEFEELEPASDRQPMVPTLRAVATAAVPTLVVTAAAPDMHAGETTSPSASASSVPTPDPEPPAVAQRIVALRVSALKDSPWTGVDLMTALEDHGMAHGRYQVFHRKHSDGRTLFCAASLVEPGSFDLQRMPREQYRGVSLFAILPGPLEPMQTLDVMMIAAHELAESLNGVVQDAAGEPLSPERAAALRREVEG